MQKMPVGILGVASLLAIAGHAQAAPKTAKQVIADQYICVFKPSITQPNVQAQANRVVGAQGGNLLRTYRHSIRGFAAHMSAQAVARIDKVNSGIAFCEQDQVASASQVATAKPGSGGGSVQPAQTIPWGVKLVGGGITTSPALAWVIDSGIDLTHPDLNVNKTGNISFTRDSSPNDGNGHGTHVAVSSRPAITASAWSAWRRALRSFPCECWIAPDAVRFPMSSLASTMSPNMAVLVTSPISAWALALLTPLMQQSSTPRPPMGSSSRSLRAIRATMPIITARRAPMGLEFTPCPPSTAAGISRPFPISAIRRSISRSPAYRSIRRPRAALM